MGKFQLRGALVLLNYYRELEGKTEGASRVSRAALSPGLSLRPFVLMVGFSQPATLKIASSRTMAAIEVNRPEVWRGISQKLQRQQLSCIMRGSSLDDRPRFTLGFAL